MSESNAPEWLELHSTVMTMIKGALEVSPEIRRENFDRLIRYYRPPLIHHLTARCRVSIDEADDVVQSFLVRKLLEPRPEENLVAAYFKACGETTQREDIPVNVDDAERLDHSPARQSNPPRRIRFRYFLRKSLRNYLIDHYRKSKRNAKLISMEEIGEEDGGDFDSVADTEFDQVWARNLLRMAIDTVREECESKDLDDVWFVFYERSLRPLETGEPAPSFDELCASGRFATSGDASNRYETARRKVKKALRNHITEYLPRVTSEQITEELLSLKEILLSAASSSNESFRLCDADSLHEIFLPDPASDEQGESVNQKTRTVRELWNEIVAMSVTRAISELRNSPMHAPTGIASDASLTIQNLIAGQHPPLPLLRLLKDQAKQTGAEQRNNPEGNDRVLISRVLYAVAIALAKLVHGAEISSRPGIDTLAKFELILNYEWLDDDTKSVIRRWLTLFAEPVKQD